MEFVLVSVALISLAAWWFRRTPPVGQMPAPDWTFTDGAADPWPGHERVPDRVDHALHLAEFRYRVVATWYNSGIAAESDTSTVTEEYDVRRDDRARWHVRLATRNGFKTEGGQWQEAPAFVKGPWEALWKQREHRDPALRHRA